MFEFFQNIVRFLNDNNISYMLPGGVAMSVYVVPRTTRDMDFIVHLQLQDVNKLMTYFVRVITVTKMLSRMQ